MAKIDPAELSSNAATLALAHVARLRYVTDATPGFTRVPAKAGFQYRDADGKPIRDQSTLERIASLAIPPAWTDVWICPSENGHIQATGRDARQRKQYRYHPRWRSVRDEVKYGRMADFGKALPVIRRHVHAALKLPGMTREKVLATIVYLLQATLIRIGNEEYARSNQSFGLSTLRNRHVHIDGAKVEFVFRGKSGIKHQIALHDPKLARIIRRMRELPGQELFQYVDDAGERHTIGSSDVNEYLRELTNEGYTAKDFRTWYGTILAALALLEYELCESETQIKKNIALAVKSVEIGRAHV